MGIQKPPLLVLKLSGPKSMLQRMPGNEKVKKRGGRSWCVVGCFYEEEERENLG